MSWKLAEWRWREQAPLRERSLWKIWDVEDAVKNGDIVEEAVRLAYHFPNQGDGCWQSRIEMPQGGRLGSIRPGTNPHPPPQTQLPDLPPQHHNSYHPSRSSSVPLLASIEEPAVASGDSSSTPSISVLLSKSTSSTPTPSASPRTPQVATDFLDTRDWNHLALDQKVDSKTVVTQLRSSFGLFSKAVREHNSPRRDSVSPRHFRLVRASSLTDPVLHGSPTDRPQLHRRNRSVKNDNAYNHSLQNRIVPFSDLDTVLEHQNHLLKHYFRHEGVIFEVLNPHESFGEHSALSPRISSEEPSYFQNSSHDSASLLLPDANMRRFTIGESDHDESTRPKEKRNDTPPAKVFQDLPAAHSGILGQIGDLSKIKPLRETKTKTGTFANLPPLIDLPRTTARPGPASVEVQQKLAEAKALRVRQQLFVAPENPLARVHPQKQIQQFRTQAQHDSLCGQSQFEDAIDPAGDFVESDDQIKQLHRTTSHESRLNSKVLVRNSRSFFDLDREYRRAGDRFPSATSGVVEDVIDMYSCLHPRQASNVLVRDSQDIIGIAISGDENYTHHAEDSVNPILPAPLRVNRRRLPTAEVPQIALPPVPAGEQRHQYPPIDVASSEAAEYDNTQSLLNVGRYDPQAGMAKDFQTQVLRSRREAEYALLQNVRGNLATSALQDVQGQQICPADEFGHDLSRCSPHQPEKYLSGFSQITADSEDTKMLATAPYHGALKAIHNAVNNDNSSMSSPEHNSRNSRGFTEHEWTSSQLSRDEEVSKIDARNNRKNNAGITGQVGSFQRDLGSAEWFANSAKKDFNKQQNKNGGEEPEDNHDWETIQSSGNSGLLSQATIQPPFELLPILGFKTDPRTDPSLANLSSSGSMSTSQGQPATPWDPIPREQTRTHPALSGTPHKYRLRKDVSTGEEVLVPEYCLPEFGQHGSSADPFKSAQAAPDLPAGYPFPVSKFSASTPRQHALGDDTSSDQNYPSSPLVFSQGRYKATMAAASEEHHIAQGRVVHELEGDQVYGVGVAVSTDVAQDNKQNIPEAESVYSLASDDIIQDEPLVIGATIEHHASTPSSRATLNNGSSDKISVGNGMQYREQAVGIEMKEMGLGRDFSIGTLGSVSSGSGYLQNSSSQASIPFQSRLMSQGRFESEEDLIHRLSTIQDDGSYDGEEDNDAASLSSFMRDNNPLTARTGTFNKRVVLGTKHNLAGTGSSPANISSDIYDSVKQQHHSYGQLSSGPESGHEVCYEGNTDHIANERTDMDTAPREDLTRKQVKEALRNNGVDVKKIVWGNVQKDITCVTFPMGQAISAPRLLVLPRTIPPVNSLVLTKEQPLRRETTTDGMLKDRIEMAMDDWYRLNQSCPVFPLRNSHLSMKFTESDPRRTGDNVCNRGGISRINGSIEEDAFCFKHNRREFSTLPAMRKTPLSAELMRMRKEAGREIVWMCLCVPVIGWVLLYYLWKDEPGVRVDDELMRWKTKGVIQEIGEEEIEFAGRVLLWFGLGLVGVAFACLAVLLWAFL